MRKLKPMSYQTKKSTDPSVPLMKIVNDGTSNSKVLRDFLLRSLNVSPALVDRLLAG